jgi:hypothetical protein
LTAPAAVPHRLEKAAFGRYAGNRDAGGYPLWRLVSLSAISSCVYVVRRGLSLQPDLKSENL